MLKRITLTNPRYGIIGSFYIKKEIYDKHCAMHPIRPEEALQSELSICYGYGTPVTEEMIERVIEDEFVVANNIEDIIRKARELYKNIGLSNKSESVDKQTRS